MQFKDEYKQHNLELEKENEHLRHENTQLFCTALNDRDVRIAELEDSENILTQQVTLLDSKCRSSTSFFYSLNFIDLIPSLCVKIKFHRSSFPHSILVAFSWHPLLTSHKEIGCVITRPDATREDPREDVCNKSCMSCSCGKLTCWHPHEDSPELVGHVDEDITRMLRGNGSRWI